MNAFHYYTPTHVYYGKDGADKAQEDFINVVSNKGIPDDIQEVKVENGKGILSSRVLWFARYR